MSEEEKQIHLYMHSKNELGLATLCVEKDKEIERLKEEYMILQNASDEAEEELQQRINKAIEYIELYTETTKVDNVRFPFELKELHLSTACRKRLLDILKGVDKE